MRARTLVASLIVAGAVALARRLVRSATAGPTADDPPPSNLSPASAPSPAPRPSPTVRVVRRGSMSDRGRGEPIAIDLERARAHHVEPVVEFLTYVQSRRGDRSHLLFVRMDDLDAMAASANEPVDDFLDRLDRLGVVVSHN